MSFQLKKLAKRIVPDDRAGWLDYYLQRQQINSWGGPFNGQAGRVRLFQAIVALQDPDFVVETGTFRGDTTELLARRARRVLSVEGSLRNYGFARARLRKLPNVDLRYGDSRDVLKEVLRVNPDSCRQGRLLAYLDAHWNEDLPLTDELEIVFTADPEAIVLVDDFEVPFDRGYGYDDYGKGKALTHAYIEAIMQRRRLEAFYPVLPSLHETGARRGCVVLASEIRWRQLLVATGLLTTVSASSGAASGE